LVCGTAFSCPKLRALLEHKPKSNAEVNDTHEKAIFLHE
jgi:hypothetical protein